MYTLDATADYIHTSKVGSFIVSPRMIRDTFINENFDRCDGYKVSRNYIFTDENGGLYRLYDWKATNLYNILLPTPEIFWLRTAPYTFSVGGYWDGVNHFFGSWLEKQFPGSRFYTADGY